MPRIHTIIILGIVLLTTAISPGPAGNELFAPIGQWTPRDPVQTYLPDNLFEYINGAAEVFLSYDFQNLQTVTLINDEEQNITVDIYQHSDTNTGFGIYSQEKPVEGDYLQVGSEGYYESGILNFYKGPYYVKLSAYDLGDGDRNIMTQIARTLADRLPGQAAVPEPLHCFPQKNMIARSERYINRNFMGHGFLGSAFTADYLQDEQRLQVFIIQTAAPEETEQMVNDYLSFLRKKQMAVTQKKENRWQFQDPYYRSKGTMYLKRESRFLWGLLSLDPKTAEFYLDETERLLKKHGLID